MNLPKEVHIDTTNWVQLHVSKEMLVWFEDYPKEKWQCGVHGVVVDEEMYLLWILRWK